MNTRTVNAVFISILYAALAIGATALWVAALFAGYMLVLVGVLLGVMAVPFILASWWTGRRADAGAIADVLIPSAKVLRRIKKARSAGPARVGKMEAGFLLVALALIGGEIAAVFGGLGAYFAVVALGYFLVIGAWYTLYRHEKTETEAGRLTRAAITVNPVENRGQVVTDADILRGSDVFRYLSADEVVKVAAFAHRRHVEAGEILGDAGSPGEELMIIEHGHAQLSANSRVGRIPVRMASAGETLPLAALIEKGMLITTIEAATDMDLLVVSRRSLLDLCHAEPRIGLQVYRAIAEILGGRYAHTLDHMTTSAERVLKETGFFANV